MDDKTLGSKNLYKLFIIVAKYIPLFCSIVQIIGLIMNYVGSTSIWMSFFGGTSLIFVVLLYLISYVFRFCYLYRIPLHYIAIINIVIAINLFIGIPIVTYVALRICILISGLFIVGYIVTIYKNRNNPKVDHIKEFCERYNCNCNCK